MARLSKLAVFGRVENGTIYNKQKKI